MQYRMLGDTGFKISACCLGTMTWGEQNTEADAHRQLSYALDRGVNFIDTAEMYPVPPRGETYTRTESYIGSWFAAAGTRDQVVLATKVAGPSRGMDYIRGGANRLDRKNIRAAVEGSLGRLRTDRIDLYQLHWPDRTTNTFGKLGFDYPKDEIATPIAETVEALAELVREGKILSYGLSNETPWGVAQYLKIAETTGAPKPVSIQNAYHLLNRVFEIGLSEFAYRDGIGLLAYSPLAMGLLTGKYYGGARPPGSRITVFNRFVRYGGGNVQTTADAYVDLARQHGLDPAQMAIAFIAAQPFVTATIIGATTLEQLEADIDAFGVKLSPEVVKAIDAIHRETPNPAP
jgi:aryl-alcohol dehydrogenase-like predicted oxidoreductase